MAMAPTGSGKQAEGSLLLDGVNAGRVLFPHIIEDARRRGMIDSNGYLKVGTK
jgi:hypothetical protein